MDTIADKFYNRVRAQGSVAVFDTHLAVAFGLQEGIFLSRLIFFCRPESKLGKYIDGERWYYSTYANWVENSFPWLNERNMRKLIIDLESRGLILSMQDKTTNRQKYYRPNFEELWELLTAKPIPECADSGDDTTQSVDVHTTQIGNMEPTQKGNMLINSNSLTVNLKDINISSNEDILSQDFATGQNEEAVKPEPTKIKMVYPKAVTPTEPKAKKPRAKKEPAPKTNYLFYPVAEVCKMDPALVGSRIAKAAHALAKAGYTREQVLAFTSYWEKHSYVYRKYKKPPTPEQLIAEIKISLEFGDTLSDIPEEDQLSYAEQQERRLKNANAKTVQRLYGPSQSGEW